jgi:hypothetical protein
MNMGCCDKKSDCGSGGGSRRRLVTQNGVRNLGGARNWTDGKEHQKSHEIGFLGLTLHPQKVLAELRKPDDISQRSARLSFIVDTESFRDMSSPS